jgi:hypothetical protein
MRKCLKGSLLFQLKQMYTLFLTSPCLRARDHNAQGHNTLEEVQITQEWHAQHKHTQPASLLDEAPSSKSIPSALLCASLDLRL